MTYMDRYEFWCNAQLPEDVKAELASVANDTEELPGFPALICPKRLPSVTIPAITPSCSLRFVPLRLLRQALRLGFTIAWHPHLCFPMLCVNWAAAVVS